MPIYWDPRLPRDPDLGPPTHYTRQVRVPESAIRMAIDPSTSSRCVVVPVRVEWPELRLTNEQIIANGLALAAGDPLPYPDYSIFEVVLPCVPMFGPVFGVPDGSR